LHIVGLLLALSSTAVVGQTSTTRVTRLLQFDRVLVLDHTSDDAANVSIGDLTGDGRLDIVLAKGRHSPAMNRVLVNDAHGRFPVAHDLGEVADRSYSAGLVDLDGDGDLDVVVSNDTPDPKPVYLNDGKGVFRLGSTYGRPEWPMRNASVADLNRDGLPDIIAANRTGSRGGANYVCLNRGKGTFDADCLAFSRESATTITPADINGDGFIDLVVPHREGGQSHVYLNDGNAGFPKRVPFGPADAGIRVAEAADLDGDGLVDIVGIEERRGTFVFLNRKGEGFGNGVPLGANDSIPYALAVGDVNADGRIDILVGNMSASSEVFFNDGSGRTFTPVQFGDDMGLGVDRLGTVYGFAIGDLDKDGNLDIAVARSGAPSVAYFGAPASRDRAVVPAARPPRPGLISGFDGNSIGSAFGHGWEPASDVIRGGRSVARVSVVSGGARGSAGALRIEGEVAPAPNAWAGATFWPGRDVMRTADLAAITRLSFWAKGDGGTYSVNLTSSSFRSGTVTFVAGPEWREYAFDLSAFGVDTRRVLWVNFATGPKPGRFAFQIDEVRLQ
jgi:hypothetical protein